MTGHRDAPATWDFINLRPAELLAGYTAAEEYLLDTANLCGTEFNNIITPSAHPEICATIREIMTELHCEQPGFRSAVRSLVWSLLVKLHRIAPPEATNSIDAGEKLQRLKPALEYIAANFHRDLPVAVLAARCHSSVANFRKIFHAAMAMSPMAYIIGMRMKIAAVLLASTDRSIHEIATESGCPTLSNFNRHFVAVHKISPRSYRAARRK